MASSSFSLMPHSYKFNVFSSFHGPDVRKTLLSHLREQFNRNGITMFDDQEIERSATIAPSLTQAIEESRISIVILSKKYASSSWCLDELVKILECKRVMGQIVMTVFYGVEPSDVRKQIGEFGMAFDETCESKTDEERQKWRKALNEVANIAGEDFKNWDNEANMIKKIARDVSHKLNVTPSNDFEDMVGLEAHLRVMESLLDLDNVGVKIVGISGPAGIGKTTIARALQNLLSHRFQLTCFMGLRGRDLSGLHDYSMQLHLQEQLLSKVLNQDVMRICHLGVLQQRLSNLRVLIILDDVNNLKQLEVLAKETTWFGPGSRIVITTENKELLRQHGINNTYHVGFPSSEEALKILSRYAFKQTSPCHGFEELAKTVTELCDKLPLGLCVMGSSLRGKQEDEWENVVKRLKTTIDPNIEDVLRVRYESLDENEQALFLHIAVFFNKINGDLMKTMFADSDLDVKYGLKILENRSLIEIRISRHGDQIVMHRLLQQVGNKVIDKQDPWRRQTLIDADEICDVLESAKGTRNVVGISFDISSIDEVSISKKAFKIMPNLRFLRVYKSRDDGSYKMHVPEEMEFPRRLRLLDWEAYPSKSLPPTFNPEYLVKLDMKNSQLKKLWGGVQPLTNLKMMNLSSCFHLEELPDLSKATNLEKLFLNKCKSLVEIPSSFSHLQKLKHLWMRDCINLQVIPVHMNLASLEQLMLKGLKHLPKSVEWIDLSYSDYERIPDCIKVLHQLEILDIDYCRKLTSLSELPSSLIYLTAENCESLETVFFPLNNKLGPFYTNFTNCTKLGKQAQKSIIGRSIGLENPSRCYSKTLLPGREVPAEFDHRAIGSSLTIVLDGNISYAHFVFCLVFSRNQNFTEYRGYSGISHKMRWRLIIAEENDGYPVEGFVTVGNFKNFRTEHLFIYDYHFQECYRPEVNIEMNFEFSSNSCYSEIIECGAKILTQEDSINWNYEESGLDQVFEGDPEQSEDSIKWSYEQSGLDQVFEDDPKHSDRTDCWNWLYFCFDPSLFLEKCQKLCFWRKQTIESETGDVSIPGIGHAKILTEEHSIKWSYEESGLNQVSEDDTKHSDQADCWNRLFLCFDLSLFVGTYQNLKLMMFGHY